MKKNLKVFMACGVLLVDLPLMAETEYANGYNWTYRINGDTAEIYNGGSCAVSPAPTGAVTIPDTLGRKSVTSIGDHALHGCSGLTSVTMPEDVISIGAYAFEDCCGITNIATRYYASLNVQAIGDGAFLGCSGLADSDGFVIVNGVLYGYFGAIKDVVIPEEVDRISSRAFDGRSDVTSISIPDCARCTRSFCCDAFDGCPAAVNQDGFIVVGNILCRYLGNSNDIVVPDNVKIIADKAFLDNVDLAHITISTNLQCIGTDAFAGCTNLVVNIECPCPENYAYSGIVDVKEILFPTNDVYYDTYEISNYATALSAWVEAALYIDALGILQVTGSYYNDQTFNESYSYLEGWVDRIGEEFSLELHILGGGEYVIPVYRDDISTSYFGNWTIHVPCPWEALRSGPPSACLVLASRIYHGTLQSNDQWPWAPLIQITSGNIVNCSQKVFRPGDIVAFEGPSGYYYYGGLNRIEGLENYDLWNIFDNLYNGYMDIMGTCHNGVYYWRVPSAYDIVGCDAALLGEVSTSTYDAASPYRRYWVDAGCFYGIWERYADDIACEILPEIETVVATFDLGQHSEDETMLLQRTECYHLIQDPWASTWETLVFTNPSSGVESHESGWLVEDGWRFIGWKLVSGCVKPDAYSSQAMNLGDVVPSVDGYRPEGNCEFEAVYEAIAYNINFVDELGAENPNATTYTVEGHYDFQPPAAIAGWDFLGWDVTGVYNQTGDITVTAQWARSDRTVTFDIGAHGTRTGGGALTQTVVWGEAAESPSITADVGWVFTGWDADISQITESITVTAQYERAPLSIEAASGLDKVWTTSGNVPWYTEWSDAAHDGVNHLHSGTIGDSQESWIETVVTNTGVVSFWWKASSEAYRGIAYDKVVFSVDGVEVASIGGEVDWTNVTYAVEGNGPHALRWTYRKDDSDYGGEDCAWLDEVQYLREVRVAFENGGATDGSVPAAMTVGEGLEITLPGQGTLAWPKHRFSGWRINDDILAPGTPYTLGYDDVLFTAAWEEKKVSAPTIEVAAWYDTERTAVTMECETVGAVIHYTLDGSTPTAESPVCTGSFYLAGSATIKAIAVLDDYFDSDVVSAESVRAPWTPGECLNVPNFTFSIDGDATWFRDRTVTHDSDTAMRSGAIGDGQTSWIETSVSGAGTLTFWWKVSSEAYKGSIYDYARFTVDGDASVPDIGGEIDWRCETVTITGSGVHTLRWAYVKDSQDKNGSDCAWLDEVTWTPVAMRDPIPQIVFDDEVAAALAGTTDASLVANVTNSAQYAAYRDWALSVTNGTTTAQMIKESTRTWLSFALGADALIGKELTSDDVKIESFTPASSDGKFEFTVSVKDVNIGGGSVAAETLKENLKKVLCIEGATMLSSDAFSSDNIDITFDAPVDGKARFTVTPPADAGNSFFMRVKVK